MDDPERHSDEERGGLADCCRMCLGRRGRALVWRDLKQSLCRWPSCSRGQSSRALYDRRARPYSI